MLLELNIKNFIIIDQINVKFDPKLNIITGETGAGKSIIIEAINLALGKKLKNGSQKIKKDKATIELVFDIDQHKKTYERIDSELINDGLFVVSREIYSNGKSISRLNGKIISQGDLRAITAQIIDVHGQHMHQSLLDEKTHIETIDSFGAVDLAPLIVSTNEAYDIYQNLVKERISIEDHVENEDLNYILFQFNEISQASINLDEDEKITEEYNRLNNLEEYISEIQNVIDVIDGSKGIVEDIAKVKNYLRRVENYNGEIENYLERIESMRIDFSDISYTLSDSINNLEFDSVKFNKIEKRIDLLNTLMKKYGPTLQDVLEYEKSLNSKIEMVQKRDDIIDELNKKITAAYDEYISYAKLLSDQRKITAQIFDRRIVEEINQLNLNDIVFETQFVEKTSKDRYIVSYNGIDEIKFHISMNKGMKPMPLKEVASGGEISRIMLGIKAVLSKSDTIDTMIFDEIDTGISGETAYKVGKKMAELSIGKQIIAITHLPQIAATANRHFKIEKLEGLSNLIPLSKDECVEEVARIISGQAIDDFAMENSRSLIEQAQNYFTE